MPSVNEYKLRGDLMNLTEERKWIQAQLEAVADFWLKNGMDEVNGGVYTCLDKDGKVWEDNGVYCEPLGDGWFRVTLKIAELDRTNNNANANNAPATIGLLYTGNWNTATGTIRNVQVFTEAEMLVLRVVTQVGAIFHN